MGSENEALAFDAQRRRVENPFMEKQSIMNKGTPRAIMMVIPCLVCAPFFSLFATQPVGVL
jgi:hypothetical protein